MAFVLETVLLLLFRLAYARNMQDIEIVLLPLWNAEDSAEVVIYCNIFIFIYVYNLQNLHVHCMRIGLKSTLAFL